MTNAYNRNMDYKLMRQKNNNNWQPKQVETFNKKNNTTIPAIEPNYTLSDLTRDNNPAIASSNFQEEFLTDRVELILGNNYVRHGLIEETLGDYNEQATFEELPLANNNHKEESINYRIETLLGKENIKTEDSREVKYILTNYLKGIDSIETHSKILTKNSIQEAKIPVHRQGMTTSTYSPGLTLLLTFAMYQMIKGKINNLK